MAKGPDMSYATFLTSNTHTILIVVIITPGFVISEIIRNIGRIKQMKINTMNSGDYVN